MERGLWPRVNLNLECPKPKCLECQAIVDCKICVEGKRCDSCKIPNVHNNTNCGNGRSCDACEERKKRCKCTRKVYCPRRANQKLGGKCQECENMPPKCTSNNCCARRLLSIQLYFLSQKCGHCVMYYPKFHCELNHIEKFWCHAWQAIRQRKLRLHTGLFATECPSSPCACEEFHNPRQFQELHEDDGVVPARCWNWRMEEVNTTEVTQLNENAPSRGLD